MLFIAYKQMDSFHPLLSPSQRQFFPVNPNERTMDRFLNGLPVIYEICRDVHEESVLQETFNEFWDKCKAYLVKVGTGEQAFMSNPGVFYRMSFNYWRREFRDQPEGLDAMYNWFRACFGIEGNEEYCVIDQHRERCYDWMKMRACSEALNKPVDYYEPPMLTGEVPELSEDSKRLLRETIEKGKKELEEREKLEEQEVPDV